MTTKGLLRLVFAMALIISGMVVGFELSLLCPDPNYRASWTTLTLAIVMTLLFALLSVGVEKGSEE